MIAALSQLAPVSARRPATDPGATEPQATSRAACPRHTSAGDVAGRVSVTPLTCGRRPCARPARPNWRDVPAAGPGDSRRDRGEKNRPACQPGDAGAVSHSEIYRARRLIQDKKRHTASSNDWKIRGKSESQCSRGTEPGPLALSGPESDRRPPSRSAARRRAVRYTKTGTVYRSSSAGHSQFAPPYCVLR